MYNVHEGVSPKTNRESHSSLSIVFCSRLPVPRYVIYISNKKRNKSRNVCWIYIELVERSTRQISLYEHCQTWKLHQFCIISSNVFRSEGPPWTCLSFSHSLTNICLIYVKITAIVLSPFNKKIQCWIWQCFLRFQSVTQSVSQSVTGVTLIAFSVFWQISWFQI